MWRGASPRNLLHPFSDNVDDDMTIWIKENGVRFSGEIRGTGNAAYTYNATKQYEDDGGIGEEIQNEEEDNINVPL